MWYEQYFPTLENSSLSPKASRAYPRRSNEAPALYRHRERVLTAFVDKRRLRRTSLVVSLPKSKMPISWNKNVCSPAIIGGKYASPNKSLSRDRQSRIGYCPVEHDAFRTGEVYP